MFLRAGPRHLFAALMLLAGQWLLFAHAMEHSLNGEPERIACEICAIAHASAPPPPTPLLPQPLVAPLPIALQTTPLGLADAQLRLPPTCGPPACLA